MLMFTTDDFYYDSELKTFSVHSSDLRLSPQYWNSLHHTPVETVIKLTNPKTNNSKVFKFDYADIDGDEAYGWNYKCDDISLLIINY